MHKEPLGRSGSKLGSEDPDGAHLPVAYLSVFPFATTRGTTLPAASRAGGARVRSFAELTIVQPGLPTSTCIKPAWMGLVLRRA